MGKVSKVIDIEPEYGTPDDENPLWTAEDFARAIFLSELARQRGWPLPPLGRPRLANPKQAVNLRLDPAIVTHFKSGGRGWQTRINAVLKAHVEAEAAAIEKPARAKKRA